MQGFRDYFGDLFGGVDHFVHGLFVCADGEVLDDVHNVDIGLHIFEVFEEMINFARIFGLQLFFF